MAETSTIFGFMKYVSATDILSDFKKTVDNHFVNSLKDVGPSNIFYIFLGEYPTIFNTFLGESVTFHLIISFSYKHIIHTSITITLFTNRIIV